MKIILCGKARTGKDSVAKILCESNIESNIFYFYRYAFADKVKSTGKDLFPEEFDGGKKPRQFLQWWGNTVRQWNDKVWINHLLRKVNHDEEAWNRLWSKRYLQNMGAIITDCRYLNELETAKENGFIPVRVVCDEVVRLKRIEDLGEEHNQSTDGHVSETELDGVFVEWEIDNSGNMEDLHLSVMTLLEELNARYF